MRLFYAAFLSPENMRAYQTLVDGLMKDVPGALRPIPSETHHLTLAFLGDIAESDVDKCVAVLEVVESFEAFSLSLGRPRILMGRGRPRLICADITAGREQVSEIQAALSSHLSERLPSIDTRPKPPHVTLARFKKNARRSQARRAEDAIARRFGSSPAWEDRFASVHLVKSSLTPSGPVYESVGEVHLAGR